jgi:hypothetical protein
MQYTTKVPLNQDNIKLFIKSFEDGDFEHYEQERDHPTITHNGRGASIWNNIFTQIEKNFTKEGFQVNTLSRGPWELAYVYDENTKYLYTFMRSKNFVNLQKRSPEDKIFHYCSILSRLNGELLHTYQPEFEQISFGLLKVIDGGTDIILSELLNSMLTKIDGDVERYALVLVEQERGIVTNIECIIPIEGMSKLYTESWKEYIGVAYDTTETNVEEAEPVENDIILFMKDTDIKLEAKEESVKKTQDKN